MLILALITGFMTLPRESDVDAVHAEAFCMVASLRPSTASWVALVVTFVVVVGWVPWVGVAVVFVVVPFPAAGGAAETGSVAVQPGKV